MSINKAALRIAAVVALAGLSAAQGAFAQKLDKVKIVIFGAPSLGAFLPPIIKAEKFDTKNGVDITFEDRTPDAYTTEFNSGEFQVGGSAAVLTVGLADLRGVKATYLFNLFDYWGGIVTNRPNVKTLKDLQGKTIAAASGTTNYIMFEWFARQQGLDVSKAKVVNTATPGLVGYALADRAAAVQLWEPAYTSVITKKPSERTLGLDIKASWRKFAGSNNIPYLGVAAHTDWAKKHKEMIPKIYAAYKDAAQWIVAHPGGAAKLISPKGSADDQKAIAQLIRSNGRLGLNMAWASKLSKEIKSVYAAGKSIGYLPSDPSDATIYSGPTK
ncbi:MAG TPA: ABC transporter substrate-binding protein [Beijerinckiaceae bacterium]|nr:ABC transporter substrate-binding protein [Beijerinckiaceae bacterium]HVB89854.1 ABC transporter substrate-binding protein [Beijerinckiaceae bacterium]